VNFNDALAPLHTELETAVIVPVGEFLIAICLVNVLVHPFLEVVNDIL
jgi:hypothetical protein